MENDKVCHAKSLYLFQQQAANELLQGGKDMEKERMNAIISKMEEELFNSVEEKAVVEGDGEDGELSHKIQTIMNCFTEMIVETTKHFRNPNAGKSPADAIRDAIRDAAEDEQNDDE